MNPTDPASGQPDRLSDPAETPSTAPAGVGLADSRTDSSRVAAFASTRGRYYAVVLALFCCILLISNIAATKVIGFGPIVTDGGAFLFPIAYILGDVISEVYGFAAARKAVITGFAMQLLATAVFFLVQVSPPGPGYENQDAFEAVIGFYPRIVLASMLGYVVGQLLNSFVLVRIKRAMGEKRLWVRLLTSTGVGEAADTVIFCTVAFAGVIPGWDFLGYVIFGFVYKVAVEVILMPVTYRVIKVFKKHEHTYSVDTDLARRAARV
ncbi:queuosine precursor transporter [Brevibacterium daeguense]|uniref:Probable queuosine precursor transporter n=1 Tax=Brevibacterium daeguense TaxID=909936 RepID=A0ABP8EL37_9MICO|nr:queuosine precursor transporter [Brevibacterium daeguense]